MSRPPVKDDRLFQVKGGAVMGRFERSGPVWSHVRQRADGETDRSKEGEDKTAADILFKKRRWK
jgi:hypothetical protein